MRHFGKEGSFKNLESDFFLLLFLILNSFLNFLYWGKILKHLFFKKVINNFEIEKLGTVFETKYTFFKITAFKEKILKYQMKIYILRSFCFTIFYFH